MSTDVKAFGVLKYETKDDLDDVADAFDLEEGDTSAQIKELVESGLVRKGRSLTLKIHGNLSADANVSFQDWLDDLVDAADSGHVDTWQESFGDEMFVRVHAGGRQETITGPFPSKP